jgi:hypothetical protein
MIKDGYFYSLGKSKASMIFMKIIHGLPKNHFNYTLRCIQRFVEISKYTRHEHRDYVMKLILEKTYKDASKYLNEEQKDYLQNVLKTKLKELKDE